jgi:hypothetical protein
MDKQIIARKQFPDNALKQAIEDALLETIAEIRQSQNAHLVAVLANAPEEFLRENAADISLDDAVDEFNCGFFSAEKTDRVRLAQADKWAHTLEEWERLQFEAEPVYVEERTAWAEMIELNFAEAELAEEMAG